MTLSDAGVRLIDCVHKTPSAQTEGFPYVGIPQMKSGRIDFSDARLISEADFIEWTKKAKPQAHDVILSRRTNPGVIAIDGTDTPFALGQNLVILRADGETVFPPFLRWLCLSPAWWEQIDKFINVGAVFSSLRCADVPKFELSVPPLSEQAEIAAVLGALDDKIELNRKTAATLEAMARALYRSWFVDFDPVHAKSQGRAPAHMDPATAALFPDSFGEDGLPEGWRNGTLGDVARNVRDQIQPSEVDAETPYIGLEHIPRRALSISDWGTAEKVSSAKTAMRRGQFLFGKLRPYFHKVGLVPADGICSTDILVIEARANHLRALVANVISSDEFVSNADSSSSGTRMPRANWRDMARFEIALPNDNVARAFSREVNPMHERLLSIIEENRTLATLRDTLLPRLMSGDLRVGEAREQVEDVA